MLKKIFCTALLILIMISCTTTTVKKEIVSTPAKPAYFTGYVVRENVNMRSGASIDSAEVAKLKDGEDVTVLQNKNGWYQVQTVDNTGWVRSDFIGEESFSYSRLATNFMEKIKKEYNTELFIDKENPYAVIYLVLPDEYYDDKITAQNFADEIGKMYQRDVFPGELEIRVLQQNKKKLYIRSVLKSTGPTFLKPPFLRYGRPFSFKVIDTAIKIQVLVPPGLTDKNLLDMANEISSGYGEAISKVEIYMVEDTPEGQKYYSDKNFKPMVDSICRLYFIEDSRGTDYKTSFCKSGS